MMTSLKLDPASQSVVTSHGRNWMVSAGVLGVLGVVLVALTFPVKGVNEDLAGWSYTIGFLALYGAIVSFLVGWILDHGAKPTFLPVTLLGWVVVAATVLAVVFFFTDLVILGFLVFGAAAMAGVVLVLMGQERSVPVFALPLFGAMFAVAFVLGATFIAEI